MHYQTIELLSGAFYTKKIRRKIGFTIRSILHTKKIRRKIGSPSGVVVRFFFPVFCHCTTSGGVVRFYY